MGSSGAIPQTPVPPAEDAARVALKLTPEAQKKQQDNAGFIADLVRRTNSDERSRPLGDISVSPLVDSNTLRSESLTQRLAAAAERDPTLKLPSFDVWYQIKVKYETGAVAGAAGPATGAATATTSGAGAVAEAATSSIAQEPRLKLPALTLALIHKLQAFDEVESAHALQAGPPPVNPGNNPRSGNQGYLNAAPAGIDARYAWTRNGGDGKNVNIVDLEQGWNLKHEDLVDNFLGGVGIVPSARGRVISQHRPNGYNTTEAILDASAHMAFGDLLLLEAQEFDPVSGTYYWPVEIADANFDAIRAATALGITVIQAGCNGSNNLDLYINPAGKRIFNRASADFRESGAVMVGAGSSATPHTRLYFSNYGSRMDVYGWGENVDTTYTNDTGTDNRLYTTSFSGTSSASPIVTGAAAAIQGISLVVTGAKKNPAQVRTILAYKGTASASPATDKIGVLPNLKAIIDGGVIH